MKSILWKIGGEAGFGIMTTGLELSKIASRLGFEVFDYQEYPSLIRGGHNTYEVHISEKPVFSSKGNIDILVCLNKNTFDLHKHRCTKNTLIVHDPEILDLDIGISIKVPFKKILSDIKAPQIMINNIALGSSLALLGFDLKELFKMIEGVFGDKGEEIINLNKKASQEGYNLIKNDFSGRIIKLDKSNLKKDEKLVITGNDAFSLATISADCRAFYAYPMTPASSVLSTLALYSKDTGMIVRHSEDEIAVINSALGSSFAGVRSSVATSGGGFALMVESLSYAGVAEIPVVVFLSQRPGPATGMPTWTEQGDLLFAVNAGHGEFPKIILSAGDSEEMFKIGLEAYNLADIYQLPVIVLSEKHVSESHWGVSMEVVKKMIEEYIVNRGKIIKHFDITSKVGDSNKTGYRRYEITEDGISSMLIPGQEGIYWQANSYEHLEDGHTTEEAEPRIKQVNKRRKKINTFLKKHFKKPDMFGDINDYNVTIVSWGGNKGAILDSIEILKDKGIKVRYVHFTYLYPLDKNVIKEILGDEKKCVLIENNSEGQFGKLLRQETGINIDFKLSKYDGRPIYREEIVDYIEKVIKTNN